MAGQLGGQQKPGGRVLGGVAVVALLVALHAAGVAAAEDAGAVRNVHMAAGWVGALLGLVGTVAAARTFGPGDFLRTVWGVLAAASAGLLASTALVTASTYAAPDSVALLAARAAVVTVANGLSVYALALLALTYRRSGLQPPLTAAFALLWLATAAVALAVTAPSLREAVGLLGTGTVGSLNAVRRITGTLGDLGTMLLIVPILQVAYLLRGGRLAGVWWAMALSGASWLVYDAAGTLATLLPGEPARTEQLLLVTRSLGLGLVGLSGWLQREALRPDVAVTGAPRPAVRAV
jgi:hypothetical protein